MDIRVKSKQKKRYMILNLNHRYFNERGYTCVCYIWISLPSWSFSDMELLALFVSSLGHDLDHRGTNNQYQMSSVSKARPPTSMDYLCMFYMLMIRVSYTVSYIYMYQLKKSSVCRNIFVLSDFYKTLTHFRWPF